MRLVQGETAMEGRVELCTNGKWKEVGYCGLMESEASVICKQLGYSKTGNSKYIAQQLISTG